MKGRLGRCRLALLFAVVTLGRSLMLPRNPRPWIVSDESAQLAVARVIGRAGHWTMADIATWPPGLGLLLAPLAAVIDDPSTMYRSAIGLNLVLGGLGAVAFASLVRRMLQPGRFPDVVPVLAGGVVTLAPGQVRTSAAVWAEPAVFLLVTVVMIGLVETRRRVSTGWAVTTVIAASAGVLFHHRMLPVLLVAGVTATYLVGRTDRRAGFAVGVTSVVGWWVVGTVTGLVTDRVWTEPGSANTTGSTLQRLADPVAVLVEAFGQLWYLQASSLLLFGVGAVVLVSAAVRGHPLVDAGTARVVGTVVGVSIATSVLFMAGRTDRADFVIYGRYNESVAGVVAVIGAAWIWELARRRRVWFDVAFLGSVTVSLVAALVIERLRADVLHTAPLARTMVLGIVPYEVGPPGSLAAIAVVSGLVAALAWWSVRCLRDRPAALAALAVVLVVTGGFRLWRVHVPWDDDPGRSRSLAAIEHLVPEGGPVGFELSDAADQDLDGFRQRRVALNRIQFEIPHLVVVAWWEAGHHPEFVFGPADSRYLRRVAEPIWSDPDLEVVLWRVRST